MASYKISDEAARHLAELWDYLKIDDGIEIAHILHGGRDFFSYFAEP